MQRADFLKLAFTGGLGLTLTGTKAADVEVLDVIQVLDCELKGYPHYRTKVTDKLIQHGKVVHLRPEPDNPHDEWAVRVLVDDNHIGYLPRVANQTVHRLAQAGKDLDGVILLAENHHWRSDPWHGILLAVCMYESEAAWKR